MTSSYGYGSGGLRAWKQVGGGTTYFLYDGGQPVCELDGTGAVTATNTWGRSLHLLRQQSDREGLNLFYYRCF